VPRSIPTIISSFCKLPVAMLMPILATAFIFSKVNNKKNSELQAHLF
jgi:hypothetical protein